MNKGIIFAIVVILALCCAFTTQAKTLTVKRADTPLNRLQKGISMVELQQRRRRVAVAEGDEESSEESSGDEGSDESSGSDEGSDEQSGSDEGSDESSGSDEGSDEQSGEESSGDEESEESSDEDSGDEESEESSEGGDEGSEESSSEGSEDSEESSSEGSEDSEGSEESSSASDSKDAEAEKQKAAEAAKEKELEAEKEKAKADEQKAKDEMNKVGSAGQKNAKDLIAKAEAEAKKILDAANEAAKKKTTANSSGKKCGDGPCQKLPMDEPDVKKPQAQVTLLKPVKGQLNANLKKLGLGHTLETDDKVLQESAKVVKKVGDAHDQFVTNHETNCAGPLCGNGSGRKVVAN